MDKRQSVYVLTVYNPSAVVCWGVYARKELAKAAAERVLHHRELLGDRDATSTVISKMEVKA